MMLMCVGLGRVGASRGPEMHGSKPSAFPHLTIGDTIIFPSGVVVMDAAVNLSSGSTMTSLLSVSPLSAPGGHESASGGVLVFPGM